MMDREFEPLRFWIIENDLGMREAIAAVAETEGIVVSRMSNLVQAQTVLDGFLRLKHAPDLIFSKFQLLDGTTKEFLTLCRRLFPRVPIYCLCPHGDHRFLSEMKDIGIVLLPRPPSLGELLRIIAAITQ